MTGIGSCSKADLTNAFRKGASVALAICNAVIAAGAIFVAAGLGPLIFVTWEKLKVQLPSMSLLVRDGYVPCSLLVSTGVLVGVVTAYWAGNRRGVVILNATCFIVSGMWFWLVAVGLSVPFSTRLG